MNHLPRLPLALALVLGFGTASLADGNKFWEGVVNIGAPAFWAAGLGSSLIQDGSAGWNHAGHTADGFLAAAALAEGLKYTVRERRPYDDNHDSFPSLHTSLSFEVAAAQSYYHPKQALYWYAGASVIGYALIPAHEHHWQDVLAGAALGYAAGQLSASSRQGWLLGRAANNSPHSTAALGVQSGWFLSPSIENARLGGSAIYSLNF